MTMKVTVTIDDSGHSARVREREWHMDRDGKRTGESTNIEPATTIPPGGTAEFYIHRTRDLVIEEIAE